MVFASKVTPPFLAKALPLRVAPVLKVIDSIANIFPLKSHVVPKVAERNPTDLTLGQQR